MAHGRSSSLGGAANATLASRQPIITGCAELALEPEISDNAYTSLLLSLPPGALDPLLLLLH
jgi:hypothetical protein